MDSNRGCVSSWKLTQVLGSGYSPVMVVHIVEVGEEDRRMGGWMMEEKWILG